MHDLSKWLLRVMIVLGAIGFGTVYVMRNGWTIAEMPSVFDSSARPPPWAANVRPDASPAAAPAGAGRQESFAPCQPIGRTAKGELVYSMDCQQPPAP